MIFTTPTRYAIRALSEMAARRTDQNVSLDELLKRTHLPHGFLAKILSRLVHAGILHSAKGRNGGFRFTRPAHEVRLMDIVAAIDGPELLDCCVVGLPKCNDAMPCPLHDLYEPIRQRLKDYLYTTTVADLAAAALCSRRNWRAK